ncbi:uncharacterized protein [Rutidosis leptorrhynchoides]|uniref:uncharacterized protein n=1 Tax=Rutidosis leptorrhynchoides TaxID=125765 RepID=UPI003A996E4F
MHRDREGEIYEQEVAIANAYDPLQVLDAFDFLEEEEVENEGVSIPKAPRRHFPRDGEGKAKQIYNDYFSDNPTFSLDKFRRRYCMSKQLAYGVAPDLFDEYLHMGESTAYLCLENFCKSVLHLYSDEYMRRPNAHDVQRLISKHEEIHGFSGSNNDVNVLNQSDLFKDVLKDELPPCNYTVNGL